MHIIMVIIEILIIIIMIMIVIVMTIVILLITIIKNSNKSKKSGNHTDKATIEHITIVIITIIDAVNSFYFIK